MGNIAGLKLVAPEQIDWDNFNPQSSYKAPPATEDMAGKRIVFEGKLPAAFEFEATDEGHLQAVIDPITITGPTANGQTVRFVRQSVKPYEKNGKKLNVNGIGKLLRSAGSHAKPNTNQQYQDALNSISGKTVRFVADWEAYNKDTGERIKGYRSFPEDPERPGQRKTILHAGDTYNVLDNKGNVTGQATVSSEILFANLRLKSFVEAGQ